MMNNVTHSRLYKNMVEPFKRGNTLPYAGKVKIRSYDSHSPAYPRAMTGICVWSVLQIASVFFSCDCRVMEHLGGWPPND